MGGYRFDYIEEVMTRPKCLYYKGCMQMHGREGTTLDCNGCKSYLKCNDTMKVNV